MRTQERTRSRFAPTFRLAISIVITVMVLTVRPAQSQDVSSTRPGEAVAPIRAELPAAILDDLEEARFAAAAGALEPLGRDATRSADDRAFFGWVRGIALRRAGKYDAAAAALRATLAGSPGSSWMGKLRGELAGVELARKDPADAERLARAEVEALLAPARKDRLAALVEDFARRLLEPGDPLIEAPARTCLRVAAARPRAGPRRRVAARIRLAMARASRSAGNLERAASDLRAYLADHPGSPGASKASYQLAEVQQEEGKHESARSLWTDLARRLEGPARTEPAARDLRARCLYQLGRSYLDEMQPSAEIARSAGRAGGRRVSQVPRRRARPRAGRRGRLPDRRRELQGGLSQQALDAFRAFLDGQGYRAETPQARRRQAELAAQATFQVGGILQAQGKLAEASAAFARYVDRFPSGPQLADAQRAILDIELAVADDHDRRGRFEQARAAREAFVARNPLDPRVPLALFRNGRSLLAEGQVDRAIAAWEGLIARFPADAESARPHWEIARVFEEKKADPARAIEHLRTRQERALAVEGERTDRRPRVAVARRRHAADSTARARSRRSGSRRATSIR